MSVGRDELVWSFQREADKSVEPGGPALTGYSWWVEAVESL